MSICFLYTFQWSKTSYNTGRHSKIYMANLSSRSRSFHPLITLSFGFHGHQIPALGIFLVHGKMSPVLICKKWLLHPHLTTPVCSPSSCHSGHINTLTFSYSSHCLNLLMEITWNFKPVLQWSEVRADESL